MIERILLADDEPIVLSFLKTFFQRKDRTIFCAKDGKEALSLLGKESFDLVITDLKMPHFTGLDVLKEAKKKEIPVIIMTAFGTIENAVEAMQEGAFHYLIKPSSLEAIDAVFKKAEEHQNLIKENRYLKEEISLAKGKHPIIAKSEEMHRILEQVKQVATTNASVFITGESGTGKEEIAGAIHANSLRAKEPFIKVNCAAIPETLIESEFFGHEKGAFTGAHQRRLGRFELANRGTLLLDEVTEIPLLLQPKLLRVIQEQELERVGSEKLIKVDTRIVATSNRNMKEAIEDKIFREDLYYRLNVVPIEIPPLRKRKEDILPLAEHFLELISKENHKRAKPLSQSMKRELLSYDFPGNVRELKNIIERLVVLEADIALKPSQKSPTPSYSLEEMEKRHILELLRNQAMTQKKAADLLGISVRTLRNKIKSYQLRSGSI